jgi:hypothetical protein
MQTQKKKSTLIVAAGLIALFGSFASLVGCSVHDEGAPSPPPNAPTTLDGKIKAINDSNMSQQNKDIAISLVKAKYAKAGGGSSATTAQTPATSN